MKLQRINVIRIVDDKDENIINELKSNGFKEINENGEVKNIKENEIEEEVQKRVEEIKKELEKEIDDKGKGKK